jgi:nucleoredoxin
MASVFSDTATLSLKTGDKVPAKEFLAGKSVMIYFSAHWCPPCRRFTPELAKWYAEGPKPENVEVVFASSDRDEGAFNEYFGEMPWPALSFELRDEKAELSKRFNVSGIPTLVVLDAAGALVTTKGREGVSEDPKGFPWKPLLAPDAGVHDALALIPTLTKAGGDMPTASLRGKPLLLYFSASWCGPCRGFTPRLKACYDAMRARGQDVECVFVSGDEDAESAAEYFEHMSWAMLPFAHEKFKGVKSFLEDKYEVEGIPHLVLFGADGAVLKKNARGAVEGDPTGEAFPWPAKPVESLKNSMEDINEIPLVIAFVGGGVQDKGAAARAALEEAAAAVKGRPDAPRFALALGDDKGPAGSVRSFCGLKDVAGEEGGVLYVLIDVPKRKKAFLAAGGWVVGDLSGAQVRSVVEAYMAGTATTVGIKD